MQSEIWYRAEYLSPIGKLCLHSDGEALTGVWFADSPDALKHTRKAVEKPLAIFDETRRWLDSYFGGSEPMWRPAFRLPGLTSFRAKVSDIMCAIPFGQTITYGDIAKELAHRQGVARMSAQAVGGAVGWNPVCIIIPCHRVIGSSGNLVGYGGGLQNKIALLAHEGNDIQKFRAPKGAVEAMR